MPKSQNSPSASGLAVGGPGTLMTYIVGLRNKVDSNLIQTFQNIVFVPQQGHLHSYSKGTEKIKGKNKKCRLTY